MTDMIELKTKNDEYIDTIMDELWKMSEYIHSNPELGYEEYKACKVQVDYLRANGFDIFSPAADLDTAFVASYGSGYPTIAILSEYDALPGLGHACGHNLISTSAIGAGMAVKKHLEDHKVNGTVQVIGTPAEEGGGGKIKMLEKNIFKGVDAVFMMHPTTLPTRLAGECLSYMRYSAEFMGKSAHANSHPHQGINALSSATLFLTASGLLRQHFKNDVRLTSIMTDGGIATGQVVDYAKIIGNLSCFDSKELLEYTEKLRKSAEGCAMAIGCECQFKAEEGYIGRVPNKTLSELCRTELISLDEEVLEGMPTDFGGEDLGNVSLVIPICNPYVTLFKEYKISGHTDKFRELAISDAGKRCLDISVKCMSRTIIELYNDHSLIEDAKKELQLRMNEKQL